MYKFQEDGKPCIERILLIVMLILSMTLSGCKALGNPDTTKSYYEVKLDVGSTVNCGSIEWRLGGTVLQCTNFGVPSFYHYSDIQSVTFIQ